jgi:hypothetical protein
VNRIEIIDLSPKFLSFYNEANSEFIDPNTRGAFGKNDIGFLPSLQVMKIWKWRELY